MFALINFAFLFSALSFAIMLLSFEVDFGTIAFAAWAVRCNSEGNTKSYHTFSDKAKPIKNYPSPCDNLASTMSINFTSYEDMGVCYYFNHLPILTESVVLHGAIPKVLFLNAKFDNRHLKLPIFQGLAEKPFLAIYPQEMEKWIELTESSFTHQLEIPWTDFGNVVIEYDLLGAKEAITEIKKQLSN